jgi:hypothetical protein
MAQARDQAAAAANKKTKPQLILCVKMRKETAGNRMYTHCALVQLLDVLHVYYVSRCGNCFET